METETIFITVEDDNRVTGYGSSYMGENSVEITVEKGHEVLRNPFIFRYVDGKLIRDTEYQLDQVKRAKDRELNEVCRSNILKGFAHEIDGTVYFFSYDAEAQTNFNDAKLAMDNGVIQEVKWTVREGGPEGEYTRITLTKELLDEVMLAAVNHKYGCIAHYRDVLLPKLQSAQTVEEVQKITWEMEVEEAE